MLLATGLYLFILRIFLFYHPEVDTSSYLPGLRHLIKPEIELPLYLGGWAFVTIVGLVLFFLYRWLSEAKTSLPQEIIQFAYLRLCILIDILAFIYLLIVGERKTLIFSGFYTYFIVVYLLLFIFFRYPKRLLLLSSSFTKVYDYGLSAIILVAGLAVLLLFFNYNFVTTKLFWLLRLNGYIFLYSLLPRHIVFGGLISAGALYLWFFPPKWIIQFFSATYTRRGIDVLILIIIIVSVSLRVPRYPIDHNPSFRWLPHEIDLHPHIGPINDVLSGKTPLVNSNSQYGTLNIYTLSIPFLFIPLTYDTFYWFYWGITIVAYTMIYFILRQFLKNIGISVFGIILVLLFHHFMAFRNNLYFSQMSFLRFGWWIPFSVFFFFARKRRPTGLNLLVELLITGIAFYWGFDVGLYFLVSYIVYRIVWAILNENTVRLVLRNISLNMFFLVLTLSIFFGGISVFTKIRSGIWPNWSMFILAGSTFTEGWFMEPVSDLGRYITEVAHWNLPQLVESLLSLGPLLVFLLIYALVFYFLMYKILYKRSTLSENNDYFVILVFITVFGIMSFSYYVGRSVMGNLHAVSIPLLIVFCWLLAKVDSFIKKGGLILFPFSFKLLSATAFLLFFLFLSLNVTAGFHQISTMFEARGKISPEFDYYVQNDPGMKKSIDYINTYLGQASRSKRRIALISNYETWFLVYTRSANVVDSNNIEYFTSISQLDNLVKQFRSQAPEYVFIDRNIPITNLISMENMLYIIPSIKQEYTLIENIGTLDVWKRNIVAL